MKNDFLHTTLGRTGMPVHRLGLSATYWPGKKTIHRALDEGINFFFCFGIDKQMFSVLREVFKTNRRSILGINSIRFPGIDLYIRYFNVLHRFLGLLPSPICLLGNRSSYLQGGGFTGNFIRLGLKFKPEMS